MHTTPPQINGRINKNAPRPPPYRNERQPQSERQGMQERRPMGVYMAPRNDGPVALMGAHLVTGELKMDCALPVEVGDGTLREIAQDRYGDRRQTEQ